MDLGTIKSLVDSILLTQKQWDQSEEWIRAAAEKNPDAPHDRQNMQKIYITHLSYEGPRLALAVSEWFEVNLKDAKKAFDAVLAAQYDAELDGDNNGGRDEIRHLKAQARAGQELAHAVAGWFDVQ